MLKTRVIPCLDVMNGRTVKGVGFRDMRDAGDPVALACRYDKEGADELCFLDITASIEKRRTLCEIVSRTAASCFVPLTVGGGVRSADDALDLLRAGADKVAVNSAAVADPDILTSIARTVGSQCVVAAIDARREDQHWRIYTHGGHRPSERDAVTFAALAQEKGAGEILLTSMDRDGSGHGYDIALIQAICEVTRIPVIASGGAGSAEDLVAPVMQGGAAAVLAASIFHYGQASIADAKAALARAGAPVRICPAGHSGGSDHVLSTCDPQ